MTNQQNKPKDEEEPPIIIIIDEVKAKLKAAVSKNPLPAIAIAFILGIIARSIV